MLVHTDSNVILKLILLLSASLANTQLFWRLNVIHVLLALNAQMANLRLLFALLDLTKTRKGNRPVQHVLLVISVAHPSLCLSHVLTGTSLILSTKSARSVQLVMIVRPNNLKVILGAKLVPILYKVSRDARHVQLDHIAGSRLRHLLSAKITRILMKA